MNEEGGMPPAPPTPEPPVPPPSEPEGRPGNPWERRDELGFANGLVEAVKAFIKAPAETFAQTHESGDFGSPLLFAVIISTVTAVIGQIWSLLFGASILSMLPLPPELQEGYGWMVASGGIGMVATLIMVPIFTVIGMVIWSAILHLMLLLVGGLENSSAGYEGSLRAASYAQVASLAQIVPLIGGMITLVWTLFLLVNGITRLHGTSDGKAIAAVLLPVVLCCGCIVAAVVFGVGAAFMGANN